MIQNEFIEYIDIKIGMEWDSYEEIKMILRLRFQILIFENWDPYFSRRSKLKIFQFSIASNIKFFKFQIPLEF